MIGTKTAINFNSGQPKIIYPSHSHNDVSGGMTTSNANGELLFYLSGGGIPYKTYLRNRLHQVLENDHRMFWANSIEIVNNKYYLVGSLSNNQATSTLVSTIVDMNLNNGYGGVIPGKKLISLHDSISDPVAVADHADGKRKWIICFSEANMR